MTGTSRKVGAGVFVRSLGAALQWRLLVLWALFTLLPTAIVALPLRKVLGGLLDHSVHAADWATHTSALAFTDASVQLAREGAWLPGSSMAALLVTLLLSPLLTGMVVTAARAPRAPGFGELMHGGLAEYWRLLRLLLWGLLPLALAFGIAGAAMGIAGKRAQDLVLQSQADTGSLVALIVAVLVVVIAHTMVESGRAQLIADAGLRSATRAFWRGIGLFFRRPLATLCMYVGITFIGFALALGLGMLRVRLPAVGALGLVSAFVLTQLVVMVLAWMRTARLFALGTVAVATPPRRGRRG